MTPDPNARGTTARIAQALKAAGMRIWSTARHEDDDDRPEMQVDVSACGSTVGLTPSWLGDGCGPDRIVVGGARAAEVIEEFAIRRDAPDEAATEAEADLLWSALADAGEGAQLRRAS